MKLLVVGARPGSLGAAVKELAQSSEFGWDVVTAGVADEEHTLHLVHQTQGQIEGLLRMVSPDAIVCTAGINKPRRQYGDTGGWYADHFSVNCAGPMRLLDAWLAFGPDVDVPWAHYVAVSSNSAQIPRSQSAAYCASKAALSMALRCRARDVARAGVSMSVYGYEPGLIAGTPMTKDTERRFPGQPLTRMVGPVVEHGLSPYGLAAHIVRNIGFGGPELNGCLVRLDAGEI